jgi:hypothetical protein
MTAALRRALAWVAGTRATSEAWAGAEHAEVLAKYSAACTAASEAEREKRRLRKLVDEIPEGDYGGWRKRLGDPAEVLDRDAVEQDYARRGLAVPKKAAAAPLVVEYVGDRHETREGPER